MARHGLARAAFGFTGERSARHANSSWPAAIKVAAIAMALFAGLLAMGSNDGQRNLLAVGLATLLIGLRFYSPSVCALLAIGYLAMLGGLRRWLIPILGWTPLDPLLLVCPVLVTVHFTTWLLRRRAHGDTSLSRLLSWLICLMALQILNPAQGGLAVGAAGALFYIVPILWYYLGRDVGTDTVLAQGFRVTIGIAVAAALYGLYQTWFGFTASEAQWLQVVKYNALSVDGCTRAFSFFTSAGEYACFLGFGIVLLWAAYLRGSRAALLPIPLLSMAIFLESSRGMFVFTVVACMVLWAVQGMRMTSWLPRGLLALVVTVAGLFWSLNAIHQTRLDPRADPFVQHQASGLLHPFDPEHSTVDTHVSMVNGGALGVLHNPLGYGLGATTLAASKFGATGGSTELDLVNVFVSLGLLGGILYGAVIAGILKMAFQDWRRSLSFPALGVLGILVMGLGQWLNGGQYAASALIWFCVGALDRVRHGSAMAKIAVVTQDCEPPCASP